MAYPTPENEAERNVALRSYRIMDSPPEIAFSDIGELAAQICGCPVAYVSFIEDDRFWFKSKYGLPADIFDSCPREIAFCSVTVCGADLVISPDMAVDERFRDFPFVVGDPHFRFYCAMPLVSPEGYALGTICVMDFQARELSFEQQETLRRLAHQLVGLLEHRRRMIEIDEAMRELDEAHKALAAEKSRSDELLHRILPEAVAVELRDTGKVQPRFFQAATILFADVQGFTGFTERAEPATLIGMLDKYFIGFDDAAAARGVEKVKTIGDAFLAVAGVPILDRCHVLNACLAALAIRRVVEASRKERERLRLPFFEFRIGLHAGPVIAGVVGRRRFTYDIWGDAVNVAQQMEVQGEAGRINVSEPVFRHVEPYFEATARGPVDIKNRTGMPMYFLDRLKPEFSDDPSGCVPNALLFERSGANADGRQVWP
jgi:adenylate cyclase